ncbi:uncharacterized protein LOC107432075 [Ziziphus jujuba]|uniref:Uncharacterized protein LOC107432075 n=1 Tax=Ziziphus jujuba TaxID=326968 RepID=A0A6P4AQ94_ZIZJJ|nr:uncharacterized protein LOC107432075 [Ziziphus jujuba]
MSEASLNPQTDEPKARPLGGTEYSWSRAVPGGTGITVLSILLTKPLDILHLQNALRNFQISHPILNSKLHFNPTTNSFSFLTQPTPNLQIQSFDLPSTDQILRDLLNPNSDSVTPFHLILEHELNQNSWQNPDHPSYADTDVFFASLYAVSDTQWALILRLHTSVCDRTAAVALLRGLLVKLAGRREEGGTDWGLKGTEKVSLGIENLIPHGKASKPLWARGVDMLGYSLNSFRLANLEFLDPNSPRHSQVVRLLMNEEDTQKLLDGCKLREIKLSSALAAAGLIAVYCSKKLDDHHWEKYAVVTLTDCRSILDPPLSGQHLGFYHSAILNTHDVNGRETLWELAKRCYMSFANAKNSNKHFTDMADVNFLMCKAIENPGLTRSSSLRTALISVFEDPVMDKSSEMYQQLGLEDYVGCSSVHGVGPSIAMFDTIRDGQLDCACVYPSPLHSREQMQELIDHMKKILIDACNQVENGGNEI